MSYLDTIRALLNSTPTASAAQDEVPQPSTFQPDNQTPLADPNQSSNQVSTPLNPQHADILQDIIQNAKSGQHDKLVPSSSDQSDDSDDSDEEDTTPSKTPTGTDKASTVAGQTLGRKPSIDFGTNTNQSVKTLQDAIEARNKQQRDLNLFSAADKLGAAIAGVKPSSEDYVKRGLEQADQKVADAQALMKQEADDPNSAVSQGMRDTFKQLYGYEIKGSATANELAKVSPEMEKYLGRLADVEAKKENAKMYAQQRADMFNLRRMDTQDARKLKEEQDDEKQIERYTKKAEGLEPYKKASSVLSSLATVRELIQDARTKGGQSLAMLGPQIAKGLAGEVGVLTEQDVTRYISSPDLANKLNDTRLKLTKGQLSGHSADNLLRLADIMEKKARDMQAKVYDNNAQQLARNSHLSLDQAKFKLNPNYTPESQAPQTTGIKHIDDVDNMSEADVDAELRKHGIQ